MYSENTDVNRYWPFKQGADAYIAKPSRPQDLIKTIKNLLKQQVQLG